ncbi:MAG: hypothetical protein J07AB43_07340 [Candidatus Nanosalina sp. J07AB43]|nr:MAG: hypothetical protein J07AB43_07340 [Candidatus Nanosalina sp. J07AB43]
MDYGKVERFTEFLIIGVALGTVEDAIALKLATGEPITLQTLGVIILVAIPFAAFSELVVDNPDTRIIQVPSRKLHRFIDKISS